MPKLVPPTDEQIQAELAEMRAQQAATQAALNTEPQQAEAATDAAADAQAEAVAPKYSKTVTVDGQERTFTGNTYEELVDQIAEANAALVRKNQQLKLQAKFAGEESRAKPAPQIKDAKDLTAEEMMEVAGDLSLNPGKAFDRLFEARVGMTPAQFREYQRQQATSAEEARQQAAVAAFKQAHPEYHPSANNGNRMARLLEIKGVPVNFSTLEAIYKELNEDGLLEQAANTTPPGAQGVPEAQQQRTPTRTGLRASNGANAPTRTALTERQMRSMPLKELEQAIRAGKVR